MMESAQKTSPPAEIGFAQVTMNIEHKHAKKYIIDNNKIMNGGESFIVTIVCIL